MKNRKKNLCIILVSVGLLSCGENRGVGNYHSSNTLKKLVHDQGLTNVKVSTIFDEDVDAQLHRSVIKSRKAKHIKDDEVQKLAIDSVTMFDHKRLAKMTCNFNGAGARIVHGISETECQDEVEQCTELLEEVSWEKIQISQEKAVESLKKCDSMRMGELADCFVLLNDLFDAFSEALNCKINSMEEAESLVLKKLKKSKSEVEKEGKKCMMSMKSCSIMETQGDELHVDDHESDEKISSVVKDNGLSQNKYERKTKSSSTKIKTRHGKEFRF